MGRSLNSLLEKNGTSIDSASITHHHGNNKRIKTEPSATPTMINRLDSIYDEAEKPAYWRSYTTANHRVSAHASLEDAMAEVRRIETETNTKYVAFKLVNQFGAQVPMTGVSFGFPLGFLILIFCGSIFCIKYTGYKSYNKHPSHP